MTHAHLDHTRRLPLLAKRGFKGPIVATRATIELAELVMKDSAHIQEMDAGRNNRWRERKGLPLEEPLYTSDDMDSTLKLFRTVKYDKLYQVAPGIKARWVATGDRRHLRRLSGQGFAGTPDCGRGRRGHYLR